MQVDRKSKRDVVTDVDYASEGLVIEAIRDRYPGDAILAEESGRQSSGRDRQARLRAAVRDGAAAPGSSTRWTER